jgi:hypothetical protein
MKRSDSSNGCVCAANVEILVGLQLHVAISRTPKCGHEGAGARGDLASRVCDLQQRKS